MCDKLDMLAIVDKGDSNANQLIQAMLTLTVRLPDLVRVYKFFNNCT